MRHSQQRFVGMGNLVKIFFASAIFVTAISPSWALAQQSTDDSWSDPLNLSHSGVAINPDIVIDSDGVPHAVWQDDLANYLYSRFDGEQWSTPEPTDLNRLFRFPSPDAPVDPFQIMNHTGPNPLFLPGSNRNTFAFWILPEGRVYVSNVENESFGEYVSWSSVRPITSGAASFTAVVDARGELHVAFIRTASDRTNPPGIYYTHSKNNGGDWAVPVLLYESPYFRTLDEGEANLSIATSGFEDALQVYVAWDNQPRKQVFMARSLDGGANWEEPMLMSESAPNSGFAGPFNIKIGATEKSVLAVWQTGQPGSACSQVYKSSNDIGTTWSDPQPMIEGLVGCGPTAGFLTALTTEASDPLYFLTETQDRVFLTAWNGLRWSESLEQQILAGFEEPEIHTNVILGCRRASGAGRQLYMIGCDQGEGGDVWLTSRNLGSNSSWFEPPVWSEPSEVTKDHFKMESIETATTEDGFIHTFFNQDQDSAIYYTYWNGELWSRISSVLNVPDGEAGPPEATSGTQNEIFLISRSNRGALYYTRATSGDSATESRWSKPMRLEVEHDGEIGAVNVSRDAAGTIYVAYSVPLNEKRGVYLIQSKDQGETWSEPVEVFDGNLAGFDIVSSPSLLVAANGTLHITWKEQSIQGDGVPQPLSLYYAQSNDGGKSFTEATLVVEEPVAWREVVADDSGNLHLLWQPQDTLSTVWDQISVDSGNTWQYPQGLLGEGRLVAVTSDPSRNLHLIGVGSEALGDWLWDGTRWQTETPLRLSSQTENPVGLLTAVINKQGKLMVIMAKPSGEGDGSAMSLLFSTRTLEQPKEQTATEVVPTPTLATPTLIAATATPEVLLTPTTSVENQVSTQEPLDTVETNNPVSQFAMALVPVGLLLLGVIAIVFLRIARAKQR